MEGTFAAACIVFSILFFGLVRECGKEAGREEIRSEAIKREYASYRCNKETGTSEFKWNSEQ